MSESGLRVVVVQIGSRRNYAIPVALEQAGALAHLYTDWYAPRSRVSRLAGRAARCIPIGVLKRAGERRATHLDPQRVTHFPTFALQYKWKKYLASRERALPWAYVWGGKAFCRAVIKAGIPQAHVVYCFSSVAKEVFAELGNSHTVAVLDHGNPLLAYDDRLLRQQEAVYAAWTKPRPISAGVEQYTERQREEWALADVILAPSQFCRQALIEEGAPPQKLRLLPPGLHPRFFGNARRGASRDGLRVLFAGNTPIRKGLPDLVLALERLGSRNVRGLFAGATGTLTPYAVSRATKVGQVLGNVVSSQMSALYRQADVFVLPTVSDTFPAVVLEAMAAGLPVITTPNCGAADAVREGVDGFIVPVRAPEKIAEKLELLCHEPGLLAEMSANAAARARQYGLEAYSQRLLATLVEAVNAKQAGIGGRC